VWAGSPPQRGVFQARGVEVQGTYRQCDLRCARSKLLSAKELDYWLGAQEDNEKATHVSLGLTLPDIPVTIG
jgi:hypothetical protein